MRIGVMLRAYDRPGGIGIYSRNIIKHLLKIDQSNHYLLIYNNKNHIGTYGHLPNVSEILIPSTNPVLWDQWHVPQAIKKWGVDLIFNTKFSVPLRTKIKRVMVLHGASWFVHPELYPWFDIQYVRLAVPAYCRAADFLISNSELTRKDFREIVGVPPEKIQTVHLAAGEEFKPIDETERLAEIKKKYQLPDQFLLTVASYDSRKNFATLLKAYETCRRKSGAEVKLLVVGKDCCRYGIDFKLEERGLGEDVIFPGWIEQQDLPALYNLAKLFVFPSIYEEFGIPVVEAMSCGCPVVSATTGAIPELVGGAGLLSPPFDHEKLAENLLEVLGSPATAARMRQEGRTRANMFSWDSAARKTLGIFHEVAGAGPAAGEGRG